MKTTKTIFYLLVCFLVQSCIPWWNQTEPVWENPYEAVVKTRDELDEAIVLKPAQQIINSGKIYVKGDLLFVGEEHKGFHVFDNSDQTNPVKINFIEVLACTDIAVRNDILYINQATDLVTLKYDMQQESLQLTKRVKDIFPEMRSPYGDRAYDIPDNSVVIDWKLKESAK